MKKHKTTEEEIELVTYERKGVIRFRKRRKWRAPIAFHKSARFMDYLHGDIAAEEAQTACQYEYARESETTWEVAKKRNELLQTGLDLQTAAIRAWHQASLDKYTTIPGFLADCMRCASFPHKDWQELTEPERKEIMRFTPGEKVRPLLMLDAWTLEACGILNKFKEMAEAAKPGLGAVPPGTAGKPIKLIAPIFQQHENLPLFHAIFTLDFSKTEAQLVNEFRERLKAPDNRARLEKFKIPKIGTTGKPLDRLKDLAAWRLFREMGNSWDASNEFANDKRKKIKGKAKPFHNARKQAGIAADQAELFGEDSDARKAKKRALDFLRLVLPLDFPPSVKPFMDSILSDLKED